jgi:predicted nucleic acid-binding protein
VLAYAKGVNGPALKIAALEIIKKVSVDSTFLPVHVLGELYRVLVGKAGRSPNRACAAVLSWCDLFGQIETSGSVLVARDRPRR